MLGSSVASLITAAVQIADSSCSAHSGDLSGGGGASQERAPVIRVHAPGLAKTNALLQVTSALTPRDVLERFHLTIAPVHAIARVHLLSDEFARAPLLRPNSDSATPATATAAATVPSALDASASPPATAVTATAAVVTLATPSSDCSASVALGLSPPSRPLPDIAENETLGEATVAQGVDVHPVARPSSPVEQFFLYEVGGTICILYLFLLIFYEFPRKLYF